MQFIDQNVSRENIEDKILLLKEGKRTCPRPRNRHERTKQHKNSDGYIQIHTTNQTSYK